MVVLVATRRELIMIFPRSLPETSRQYRPQFPRLLQPCYDSGYIICSASWAVSDLSEQRQSLRLGNTI